MAKKRVIVNDAQWRKVVQRVKEAGRSAVKVGFLNSKGANAPHKGGGTILQIAAVHEFGAPSKGIPERSFVRTSLDDDYRNLQYRKMQIAIASKLLEGEIDVDQALGLLGAWGANAIKNKVTRGKHLEPPLSPVTVAKKGSSRPLVDTGQLINSVNWEIE